MSGGGGTEGCIQKQELVPGLVQVCTLFCAQGVVGGGGGAHGGVGVGKGGS